MVVSGTYFLEKSFVITSDPLKENPHFFLIKLKNSDVFWPGFICFFDKSVQVLIF